MATSSYGIFLGDASPQTAGILRQKIVDISYCVYRACKHYYTKTGEIVFRGAANMIPGGVGYKSLFANMILLAFVPTLAGAVEGRGLVLGGVTSKGIPKKVYPLGHMLPTALKADLFLCAVPEEGNNALPRDKNKSRTYLPSLM